MAIFLNIAPQMEAIRVQFVGVAATPRIKLRDAVKKLLIEKKIVMVRRVNPLRMGTNMKNRFGQGVVTTKPHKLLGDIVGEGFSLLELDEPWAVEAPPKDTNAYKEIFKWNQNICAMSGGLSPMYAEDIEGTSLTCTNTNQSCRIVLQGAPS